MQYELFQLILLLKLDKQFPAEQFEATVSQSTEYPPPLLDTVPSLLRQAGEAPKKKLKKKKATILAFV